MSLEETGSPFIWSDAPKSEEPSRAADNSSAADSKFKCHICFEVPVEPVVTLCGHMYCWKCLLAWIDHGPSQCPVCKSGIEKSKIIPVYGGGDDNHAQPEKEESRPRAERTEAPPTNRGWQFAHSSFQLWVFPFGIGAQFGGPTMNSTSRAENGVTRQHRSQVISALLLTLGIFVIVYASFLDFMFRF